MDSVEFALEERNFVFLQVVGFIFEEAENSESLDLLIMGLNPNVNLFLLLHGTLQLLFVSLHLTVHGNLMISLR